MKRNKNMVTCSSRRRFLKRLAAASALVVPTFGGIFIGDKGKMEINRNKYICNPTDLIPPQTLEQNDVPDHFRNWLSCIKTRSTPNAPVEVGHRAVSVAHLINVCRQTGRRLQWDAEKERFVGDDEANSLLVKPRRNEFALPMM